MGKVIFSQASVRSHLWGRGIWLTGGYPHPRSGWGVSPLQVWMEGYPFPGLDGGGGFPLPRSGFGGGYPVPGLDSGVPSSQVWTGVPHCQIWMGVPTTSGLDGSTPTVQTWEEGTPYPDLGRGTPHPGQVPGWGGGTPYQNSIAYTCYAAGGMPLAFTQEDFLVLKSSSLFYHPRCSGLRIWRKGVGKPILDFIQVSPPIRSRVQGELANGMHSLLQKL